MEIREFEERLLALHYAYPAPLNRLDRLLAADPELENAGRMGAAELAFLLGLDQKKALLIQSRIARQADPPYTEMYAARSIIPIPYTHPLYPSSLNRLIDPPAVLYAAGDPTILSIPKKAAVIGSRKATSYSRQAIAMIVPPIVAQGIAIVSGLAKGADAMAHEAAIASGGKTIGVLGHGLFHRYPKENNGLYEVMGSEHLLLTEYPPYAGPKRWQFPMRNRIISGLSDLVIVTEAAVKSGTMSTIDHALEHGKDVLAVPGAVNAPLSAGPNRLILEGATPALDGYTVLGGPPGGEP
ncbi:DNA-processing protein DprA [Bhargavaea ullalensis]|uniref:DNA processing protein n=1 Tax=Bhargavaea ullalensis TaxID=1265685 RepID=A0ABV2GAG3_9BACL